MERSRDLHPEPFRRASGQLLFHSRQDCMPLATAKKSYTWGPQPLWRVHPPPTKTLDRREAEHIRSHGFGNSRCSYASRTSSRSRGTVRYCRRLCLESSSLGVELLIHDRHKSAVKFRVSDKIPLVHRYSHFLPGIL